MYISYIIFSYLTLNITPNFTN